MIDGSYTALQNQNIREITSGIVETLRKMHKEHLKEKSKFLVTSQLFPDGETSIITTRLSYFGGVKIVYELQLQSIADYAEVVGSVIESEKTLIARSRFKYKTLKTTIRANDTYYGTLHRIWPIVKYWQDTVQLSMARVNIFDLVYGKASGLTAMIRKKLGL
jgi:hypothetical protein